MNQTVFRGLPRDPLEAFVARGVRAQAAVDRVLEDVTSMDEARECVACGCTWDHACTPACSWREDYQLPLCSSCAPPIVTEPGWVRPSEFLDVEEEVLRQLQVATENTLSFLELRDVDLPGIAPESLTLALALLVEDGLVEVLDAEKEIFALASRGSVGA